MNDGIKANPRWTDLFRPDNGRSFDFRSLDGGTVVKHRSGLRTARELQADLFRLAIALDQQTDLRHACLVLSAPKLSLARIREDWTAAKRTLVASVARRLVLIVVTNDGPWIDPDGPLLRHIADAFSQDLRTSSPQPPEAERSIESPKYFEGVKTLLVRWLRREPPIAIGHLANDIGCSYPTIRAALRRLDAAKYLTRHSNRSVELARFPTQTWSEFVALRNRIRTPIRFIDGTGERPDPLGLLKRLVKHPPPSVALGGVLAARHWFPDFDLHGTPRLDLVLHAPNGEMNLDFVHQLDRSLRRTDDVHATPSLVVHPLNRAASLFVKPDAGGIAIADPIETALDLYEMGLTPQADQLLASFRKEARPR